MNTTGAVFNGKLEGDTLTVSGTGTFANGNAGTGKTVTISNLQLGGKDAGNYVLAASGQQSSATANITPKTIELSWGETSFTYNGKEQKPTAGATGLLEGDTCTVSVTGGETNAGTYTATADSLSNTNYKLPAEKTVSFIIAKASQTAPAAPTLDESSNTSITLTAVQNYQYRMGDGDWQNSNIFTGLTVNTEYTFYQRIKEDQNHEASDSSVGASFTTGTHVHNWDFSAEGAVLTATCRNTDGGHTGDLTSTLTVVKPARTVYGGTESAEASVEGAIDGVDTPAIVYKKGTEVQSSAPTDAGTYIANITLKGATASVEYTIAKAALNPSVSLQGWTYGDAANSPQVTGNSGSGAVTFSYSDTESGTYSATVPTAAGDHYVKAAIAESANYQGAETAPAVFTISVRQVTVSGITAGNKEYGSSKNTYGSSLESSKIIYGQFDRIFV
ncbi:MAG: hypothetical protein IKG47_12445 [Oscillospiraceae bacterium]|nr:hypothetical protein [Oscillospiraceae bacterium]